LVRHVVRARRQQPPLAVFSTFFKLPLAKWRQEFYHIYASEMKQAQDVVVNLRSSCGLPVKNAA
jgi:hypothetical protein